VLPGAERALAELAPRSASRSRTSRLPTRIGIAFNPKGWRSRALLSEPRGPFAILGAKQRGPPTSPSASRRVLNARPAGEEVRVRAKLERRTRLGTARSFNIAQSDRRQEEVDSAEALIPVGAIQNAGAGHPPGTSFRRGECGLIGRRRWVVREACRRGRAGKTPGLPPSASPPSIFRPPQCRHGNCRDDPGTPGRDVVRSPCFLEVEYHESAGDDESETSVTISTVEPDGGVRCRWTTWTVYSSMRY